MKDLCFVCNDSCCHTCLVWLVFTWWQLGCYCSAKPKKKRDIEYSVYYDQNHQYSHILVGSTEVELTSLGLCMKITSWQTNRHKTTKDKRSLCGYPYGQERTYFLTKQRNCWLYCPQNRLMFIIAWEFLVYLTELWRFYCQTLKNKPKKKTGVLSGLYFVSLLKLYQCLHLLLVIQYADDVELWCDQIRETFNIQLNDRMDKVISFGRDDTIKGTTTTLTAVYQGLTVL